MTYYTCLCTHTTADHAGHGKADCLMNDCLCKQMNPQSEYIRVKKPSTFPSFSLNRPPRQELVSTEI